MSSFKNTARGRLPEWMDPFPAAVVGLYQQPAGPALPPGRREADGAAE